jgi:hypothetical protein
LNNLAALLLLPIISLFSILIYWGGSTVYASENVSFSHTYLNDLIYKVGSLNAQRTFPPKVVTIITKESEQKMLVFSSTAEQIAQEAGIEVDFDDMVLPTETIVSDGGIVQIVKVDVELLKKSEEIPYETKEVESETLNTGSLAVEQEGVAGVKEKTIKVIHQDGKVVRSEVIATDVLLEPVVEILLVGTKPVTIASCPYWGAVVDRIATTDKEKHWMKFIMYGESGCDSGRVSRGSGAYKGLFQFSPTTFSRKSTGSIWDGTEQIKVVHQMFHSVPAKDRSAYLGSQWPHYHKVYLSKYGWN